MQNKKKVSGRSSRDVGSPRVSRQQKKLVENVQVQAKKVAELITSSVRKKKVVGTISNVVDDNVGGTNLGTAFGLVDFDDYDGCVGYNAENQVSNSFDSSKDHENEKLICESETIFSPSFHIARNTEMEPSSADPVAGNYGFYQHGGQQFTDCVNEDIHIDYHGGGGLSTETLECVDESNQHVSVDVRQGEDDSEEYDDFDPFLFIKNLPDLSSVVPTYRPMLLPKQTRSCPLTTLVLDLDETLVHSTLEPCDDFDFTFSVNFNSKDHTVYVRCRPHLRDFLERISRSFEIIIFTASQSIYAKKLLNVLDPKRKIFRHRVYRDSCVFVDGNYLKDLSVLGRDLAHVIIIDNSPQAFGFQIDNGIPIESWFDDPSDTELLMLLPFLESLVGVQDVRPLISKKFNLREKIAAAVCPLQ